MILITKLTDTSKQLLINDKIKKFKHLNFKSKEEIIVLSGKQ